MASLVVGPAVGIVAGGLLGPLVGMAVPGRRRCRRRRGSTPQSPMPFAHGDIDVAFDELEQTPAGGAAGVHVDPADRPPGDAVP